MTDPAGEGGQGRYIRKGMCTGATGVIRRVCPGGLSVLAMGYTEASACLCANVYVRVMSRAGRGMGGYKRRAGAHGGRRGGDAHETIPTPIPRRRGSLDRLRGVGWDGSEVRGALHEQGRQRRGRRLVTRRVNGESSSAALCVGNVKSGVRCEAHARRQAAPERSHAAPHTISVELGCCGPSAEPSVDLAVVPGVSQPSGRGVY